MVVAFSNRGRGTGEEGYDCATVAENGRKRQQSPNSATVALCCDKLSHFSPTVWTGL